MNVVWFLKVKFRNSAYWRPLLSTSKIGPVICDILETVQVISIHSQEVVYGLRFLGYWTSPWKTWTGVMAVILRYSPNSASWEQLRQS